MGEIFLANLGTALVRGGPPSDAQSNRKPCAYSCQGSHGDAVHLVFYRAPHLPCFLAEWQGEQGESAYSMVLPSS